MVLSNFELCKLKCNILDLLADIILLKKLYYHFILYNAMMFDF